MADGGGWCRYKRRKKWMLIEKEKLKRAQQEKQA
jgi:hypothetical protein